jgi:hypothetical protein
MPIAGDWPAGKPILTCSLSKQTSDGAEYELTLACAFRHPRGMPHNPDTVNWPNLRALQLLSCFPGNQRMQVREKR